MKSLIIINIGLTTKENTRLDIHRAIGAIAACGVSITTSAVVQGEWEGKPEPCLFIQGFVADPLAVGFRAQLYLAARLLSQHVITLYHDGKGELIGDNPEGWTFDAELFHFHPDCGAKQREAARRAAIAETHRDAVEYFSCPETPPLSECQAIQAETATRIAEIEGEKDGNVFKLSPHDDGNGPIVGGWTRGGFIHYLTETLIPDLQRDGFTSTAEDFETAVVFIRSK